MTQRCRLSRLCTHASRDGVRYHVHSEAGIRHDPVRQGIDPDCAPIEEHIQKFLDVEPNRGVVPNHVADPCEPVEKVCLIIAKAREESKRVTPSRETCALGLPLAWTLQLVSVESVPLEDKGARFGTNSTDVSGASLC